MNNKVLAFILVFSFLTYQSAGAQSFEVVDSDINNGPEELLPQNLQENIQKEIVEVEEQKPTEDESIDELEENITVEDSESNENADVLSEDTQPQEEVVIESISVTDEIKSPNINDLIQSLDLSDEQKVAARELSEKSYIQYKQIISDIESLRKQAKELEKHTLDEFVKILTDEQKAKFSETISQISEK